MLQTNRRLLTSLLGSSSRLCHSNPLGPSRGEYPPPWAAEKLLNEGYTKDEILSNWKNLLKKSSSNLDTIERMFQFIRRDHDISPSGIKAMRAAERLRKFREDQIFDIANEKGYGPDIAAAKFLLFRSAAVKLKNKNDWLYGFESAKRLPEGGHPSFRIEAIDLRNFQIIHRGFEHLARCKELKSLKMVNQKFVDDFCLDAVSAMFNLSLQYLDVSGCQLITERGLSCLHRCRELRLLNLYNLPKVKHPELLVLLLQEALPYTEIKGIDYMKEPEEK